MVLRDEPDARPRPRRRGVALGYVMLAVAVCVVLGVLFTTTAATSAQIARASDHRLRARMIAESGLDLARAYVQDDAHWRANRPHGVWVAGQSFGGGSFTLRGEDGDTIDATGKVAGDGSLSDDPLDPVTLTSVGAYGSQKYLVRATLTPAARPALAVSEHVALSGAATLDSYTYGAGPYGPSNRSAAARVSTNATGPAVISVGGNSALKGSAYSGPGGTPATDIYTAPTATLTGATGSLAQAVAIALPPFPAVDGGAPPGRTHLAGTVVLAGAVNAADFTLSGDAVAEVEGNTTLTVTGAFSLSGSAELRLKPGARLTVYAHNTAEVTGHARLHAGGDPSAVTVYVAGATASVSASAEASATLVAPAAELEVAGNANLFGSFRGRRLKVRDSAAVHFDLAQPYRVAWVEQQ